jgi:hypothetical protein
MLEKITKSPYLNLISGLVLLITASIETYEGLAQEMEFGIHHGILLYSILHLIRAIPEAMHGFDDLEKTETELNNTKV